MFTMFTSSDHFFQPSKTPFQIFIRANCKKQTLFVFSFSTNYELSTYRRYSSVSHPAKGKSSYAECWSNLASCMMHVVIRFPLQGSLNFSLWNLECLKTKEERRERGSEIDFMTDGILVFEPAWVLNLFGTSKTQTS